MHYMEADKTYREKAKEEVHENATSYTERIPEVTLKETTAVRPLASHL